MECTEKLFQSGEEIITLKTSKKLLRGIDKTSKLTILTKSIEIQNPQILCLGHLLHESIALFLCKVFLHSKLKIIQSFIVEKQVVILTVCLFVY